MKWAEDNLNVEVIERHLWTDSQCVLKWMTTPKHLSVFVENRLKEIRMCDEINTEENPADLLTRGKSFPEVQSSLLWWNGPDWLITQIWPTWNVPTITPGELSKIESEVKGQETLHEMSCVAEKEEEVVAQLPFGLEIESFSSLTSVLRITAWALRFINKTRKKTSCKGFLTAEEIKEAELLWCKRVQSIEFHSTNVCLQSLM